MKLAANILMVLVVLAGVAIGVALLAPRSAQAAISPTQTIADLPAPEMTVRTATPERAVASTTPPALAMTPGSVITPSETALPAVGWAGAIQCYNCAPFSQRVKLSTYDPTKYDPDYPQLNCYDYHDNYCWSPTASGIPWKAVWGLAAACPEDWPYGTWVDVSGVGKFICLDRGGEIKCADGLCAVDILGAGAAPWVGTERDATLWVPLNPKN